PAPRRLGGEGSQWLALPIEQLRPAEQRRCRVKRRVEGLHEADSSSAGLFPDGLFLVRVQRVQYRWQCQKPYYTLQLEFIEPKSLVVHTLTWRLYSIPIYLRYP